MRIPINKIKRSAPSSELCRTSAITSSDDFNYNL